MPRGSKPGERRGGRKKGTPNKVTATLREAFQAHEKKLVERLLKLTESGDLQVRLGALRLCFDRGWGKPPQALTDGTGEGVQIVAIEHVIVPAKRVEPAKPAGLLGDGITHGIGKSVGNGSGTVN